MESEIMVEYLPLLGVCNLCLNEDTVRSMIIYHIEGEIKELYSEMLLKCYSIDLSTLNLGDTKRLICLTCVMKLREALHFREQVQHSLKVLEKNVLTGEVKKESEDDADDMISANDLPADDNLSDDETPLLTIKKEDLLEETTAKAKRETKMKRSTRSAKKTVKADRQKDKKITDYTETERMMDAGLFPFKIISNSYSCAVCSERFTQLDDLKPHCLQHSKKTIQIGFKKLIMYNTQRFYKCDDKLRCKICTADISNYEELKAHIEKCVRLKYGKTNKWNHLPFKLEKDQLDCPICMKKFINFVSLNTHMNTHYPNYICENCGKAFASKGRLRGHIRTHEVGEFPCRYCNAVFDKVTKRENHVSREHKSGVRYACKRCNITLPSFYARQKHLAEVHNEELKRYKCKACPQSYITPGHLSSHVRRDHLNERNHRCDKCDLAFYTKNALKMHKIKHDGDRIHTCPVCQKSYQRKKTLREHLRIHNNDKRFICPVCGRAFTQKCTLKGHLKVHERKFDVDEAVLT